MENKKSISQYTVGDAFVCLHTTVNFFKVGSIYRIVKITRKMDQGWQIKLEVEKNVITLDRVITLQAYELNRMLSDCPPVYGAYLVEEEQVTKEDIFQAILQGGIYNNAETEETEENNGT